MLVYLFSLFDFLESVDTAAFLLVVLFLKLLFFFILKLSVLIIAVSKQWSVLASTSLDVLMSIIFKSCDLFVSTRSSIAPFPVLR